MKIVVVSKTADPVPTRTRTGSIPVTPAKEKKEFSMRKFRIHVLGVPHTRTNLDYTACAYTQKAFKFCKMMHERGHYIMHYGVEGSNPECDENITVVSNEVYDRVYGSHNYKQKFFRYDVNDECYQTFYRNAIAEIHKRKQPYDIILPFWGAGVRPICDAFPDLITIEPGIGYGEGSWAEFRVFESYSIMHAYQGQRGVLECHPHFYDVVIPNYFDKDDFKFNGDIISRLYEPYFLFVGRVYNGKGVSVAIDVCKKLGVKLKVAGQLSDDYANYPWSDQIEYVGYVDAQQRSELMRNAVASFLPSMYVEPFGGVQIENLLCGTPTITTDWGAFAENNIEGVTGYRCHTFDDFLNAALNCLEGKIHYEDCRRQGEKFTLENVAPKYEKFFNDVLNIFQNDGWYHIEDSTQERLDNFHGK